jgi:hypothetical protein
VALYSAHSVGNDIEEGTGTLMPFFVLPDSGQRTHQGREPNKTALLRGFEVTSDLTGPHAGEGHLSPPAFMRQKGHSRRLDWRRQEALYF